jgi:hypothetical protein
MICSEFCASAAGPVMWEDGTGDPLSQREMID